MFERQVRKILGNKEGKDAVVNLNSDVLLLLMEFTFLRPSGKKFGDAKDRVLR